jgi:hypothetical protein
MAVKTFTAGSVLTASDTNTYLANAGLVYVTSVTVGTSVTTVTVSNCFSSTYDNYRVVMSGGTSAAGQAIAMQLGPSSVGAYNTSYYQILYFGNYVTGAMTTLNVNNGASWTYAGESDSTSNQVIAVDLLSPNMAKYTSIGGFYMGSVGGFASGRHASTNQYTGFSLITTAAMTGGTVTVYGYRKA